jgi:hypothetical protein
VKPEQFLIKNIFDNFLRHALTREILLQKRSCRVHVELKLHELKKQTMTEIQLFIHAA